jgi:hypothetical protein
MWNILTYKELRVLIEFAPRFGKTELFIRIFFSFVQGYYDFIKNQYVTYGADLTDDTSVDIKTIMLSEFYKKVFPKIKFSSLQDKKSNWKLENNTEFFGTSVGGAITGKGSHITGVDDSLKAQDADSPVEKDKAWKFIQGSVFTRLEGDGALFNIMQRLAEDDPTGRFISEQGVKNHIGGNLDKKSEDGIWTLLSLPLFTDEDILYEYEDFSYFRPAGEMLPNYKFKSKDSVDLFRKSISKKEFERQYNQNVSIAETGHFKKVDITYTTDIELPEQELYIHIDSAESTKDTADDRSIGVVGWSIDDENIEHQTLMDGKRGKWDVYETCSHIIAFMIKNPKVPVYIEGAGGGITLEVVLKKEIQKANAELRKKGKEPLNNSIIVYPPNTKISKNDKIKYMTVPIEQHTFKIHKSCDEDFKQQFIKELLAFDPTKKHRTDNCIDTVASTWLFATPKKTVVKTEKKTAKRHKKKKSGKWRGC